MLLRQEVCQIGQLLLSFGVFFSPQGPSLTSGRTIRAVQQRTGLAFSGSIQADVGGWPPVKGALEGIPALGGVWNG